MLKTQNCDNLNFRIYKKNGIGMETAVRVHKSPHDRVIDENAVRVPMVLIGQCKAFGRLIDGAN